MPVEKVTRVPLRDAFRHEALNFTVWLQENIDALSESIGFTLSVLDREKSVGSFNVDLFCEDQNGNSVIVENQLERTDHTHLGQVLTYLVNLDAKVAIWVVSDVRPEHQKVIDWLNEATGADISFYLVKVEAIRIGNSSFAPLFSVVAKPDEQTKEIGETKKEIVERQINHQRKDFWTKLLEKSQTLTTLGANRSPGGDHWLTIATGKSGVNYNYLIFTDSAAIDVYIDTYNYEKNKAIFEQLLAERDAIEVEFGTTLEWRRLDDKRASRILYPIANIGSLRQPETWEQLQEVMIQAMIKLDKIFRGRIAKLKI